MQPDRSLSHTSRLDNVLPDKSLLDKSLLGRRPVATAAECEKALHDLADRLAEKNAASPAKGFDRSLSCSITDLDVAYAGKLRGGLLEGIAPTTNAAAAQIRLELTGDDLVAMVAGTLNLGSAWASGRIKVHAGFRDMIKLRSIF